MNAVAKEPFTFHTRLTLTRLTGRRAADLAEFVEHLRGVPLSVIFHHTHHFLVQQQFLLPEPPNDFAFWVTHVMQEDRLGEQIAAIDTISFTSLSELRQRLVTTIERHLDTTRHLRTAPVGEEFHFKDAISFILPTGHVAWSLPEFVEALREVGTGSIAFHLFEARLRVGREDNDFSRWLTDQLDEPALAESIRRLDPYTHTLDGLRHRLLSLLTKGHALESAA